MNFRIEIWVRYNKELAEEAPAIRKFLDEEYYQKYSDNQGGIPFKLHAFWANKYINFWYFLYVTFN